MAYEVLTDYGSSPTKLILYGLINFSLTIYLLVFKLSLAEKLGLFSILITVFCIQNFLISRIAQTILNAFLLILLSTSLYGAYIYFSGREDIFIDIVLCVCWFVTAVLMARQYFGISCQR